MLLRKPWRFGLVVSRRSAGAPSRSNIWAGSRRLSRVSTRPWRAIPPRLTPTTTKRHFCYFAGISSEASNSTNIAGSFPGCRSMRSIIRSRSGKGTIRTVAVSPFLTSRDTATRSNSRAIFLSLPDRAPMSLSSAAKACGGSSRGSMGRSRSPMMPMRTSASIIRLRFRAFPARLRHGLRPFLQLCPI
ncbi:MAG: hypothetical protein USCAAHI_02506 [Beijerinckiaceae bacterium]|nr:MAG: hypothetical protein USCAAHI_02506 [Beijerinckiaceae bacterium]